jgi:hypothetical protein
VKLAGDTPPLFLNRSYGSRAPEADFAVSFVFQSLFVVNQFFRRPFKSDKSSIYNNSFPVIGTFYQKNLALSQRLANKPALHRGRLLY